ncbi:MAG: response regulator transcription factor [Bacillota bacterium]|nr:response regulator transcription factor [Bacillota bacterium]
MSYRILVIDDDVQILRLIQNILRRSGFDVVVRSRVDEVNLCDFIGFDLILLDVMMPLDGLEICRMIRAEIDVPILLITAKDLDEDLVEGIRSGADDYITKPFSMQELTARVEMHLRREERRRGHRNALEFGDLSIRPDLQAVLVQGREIRLTKREFAILWHLASHPQQVISVERLYERVYPQASDTQFRSIAEYIYQLRNKLRAEGQNPIETVRGGGYRWNIPSDSVN